MLERNNMKENKKGILTIVIRKGILESLVYGLKLSSDHLLSIIKIFFLKLRGYDIDYSVLLRGNDFFFQSVSGAIKISKNTIIGKGNRISAGGSGKILIGRNVLIDDSTYIMAHQRIEIGKNVKIAAFCFICDFNHKYGDRKLAIAEQGYETKPVVIGDNVWIGTHSIILPGVTIGRGSVIGAGSIVTRNVPANSIAVGNPAKIIKKIK